jgi:Protein of unknown function (DUF4065)
MTSSSQRLTEAAMAILQAAGGEMQITNLNKALFYLDLVWLRDHGTTVTGAAYVAIPNGPVVDDYSDAIVGALQAQGLATQEIRPDGGKPLRVVRPISSFATLDSGMLGRVAEMAQSAKKKSATWLSDLSHRNPGWQIASRGNKWGRPINMRIALQQLPDDESDAWLKADLTPEERRAADAADADTDVVAWA